MSRHFSALLLSMIHKKILISAFLMHIDVSINWRKTIHKNIFFLLKSQKKCTNNRVFPIGKEQGELPPPPAEISLLWKILEKYLENPSKITWKATWKISLSRLPSPNFYSLPTKSQSSPTGKSVLPYWSLVVLHQLIFTC